MERFEIEEMVSQDKHGVIFRAMDHRTEHPVSIRRFFLFGQEGGGMAKKEAAAFETSANRLSSLRHESLRSVISGSVDPIDGVPFLVTEWVDGVSLQSLLTEGTMEPALVLDVVRIALEVSLILSKELGEEAVWVETEVETIVVGTAESGRGFTFWISPFKWLGAEFESRKLGSIVNLAEELTGWKKKVVGDQAGYGLGGWLKWMRNHPEASLQEALDSLASSTGKEPPPAADPFMRNAAKPAQPTLGQPSSKSRLFIAAAVAVPVLAAAYFYFQTKPQTPSSVADRVVEPIPVVAATPVPEKDIVSQDLPKVAAPPVDLASPGEATKRVEALAMKLSNEAAENSAAEARETAVENQTIEAERKAYDARGKILKPEESGLVRSMEPGSGASLRGILQGIRESQSKKTVYLNFSEPYDNSLTNGLIHKDDFKGGYAFADMEPLIGKTVVLEGVIFREPLKKAYYVKVTSMDGIVVDPAVATD